VDGVRRRLGGRDACARPLESFDTFCNYTAVRRPSTPNLPLLAPVKALRGLAAGADGIRAPRDKDAARAPRRPTRS